MDAGFHFGRTARRPRRETFALEVRQRSYAAVGAGYDLVRVVVQPRQHADILIGTAFEPALAVERLVGNARYGERNLRVPGFEQVEVLNAAVGGLHPRIHIAELGIPQIGDTRAEGI